MEGKEFSNNRFLDVEKKVKAYFFLTRSSVEPNVSSLELEAKALKLLSENKYNSVKKVRFFSLNLYKWKIFLSAAMIFVVFLGIVLYFSINYLDLKNWNAKSYKYYKLWVSYIRGKVEIYRGVEGKKITKIRVKDKIFWSDKIVTGNSSSITIETERGDFILVGSNSNVYVKDIVKDENAKKLSFFVKLGKVLFKVKKLDKNTRFTVQTPSLVAGVRGTTFLVGVNKKKKTEIGVIKGEVVVKKNVSKGAIKEIKLKSGEMIKEKENSIVIKNKINPSTLALLVDDILSNLKMEDEGLKKIKQDIILLMKQKKSKPVKTKSERKIFVDYIGEPFYVGYLNKYVFVITDEENKKSLFVFRKDGKKIFYKSFSDLQFVKSFGDNFLIVGTQRGKIFFIEISKQKIIYEANIGPIWFGVKPVLYKRMIFVPTLKNGIYVFSLDDGKVSKYNFKISGVISSNINIYNNKLYVVSEKGALYEGELNFGGGLENIKLIPAMRIFEKGSRFANAVMLFDGDVLYLTDYYGRLLKLDLQKKRYSYLESIGIKPIWGEICGNVKKKYACYFGKDKDGYNLIVYGLESNNVVARREFMDYVYNRCMIRKIKGNKIGYSCAYRNRSFVNIYKIPSLEIWVSLEKEGFDYAFFYRKDKIMLLKNKNIVIKDIASFLKGFSK